MLQLTRQALNVCSLAQEYVNGQLKNKFGDAFIRGNNGVVVWPALRSSADILRSCADTTHSMCLAVLYISTVKS